MAVALAAVARDAGPVIDQRDALADQAIEQGRLADIGSADDGYMGTASRHLGITRATMERRDSHDGQGMRPKGAPPSDRKGGTLVGQQVLVCPLPTAGSGSRTRAVCSKDHRPD